LSGSGGFVVEPSFRFNFGGVEDSIGFCWSPSGVVESSGVGLRRFNVGLPGAPLSSAVPIAPLVEARALDSRNNRAFTR
jgi:hypothetical protein